MDLVLRVDEFLVDPDFAQDNWDVTHEDCHKFLVHFLCCLPTEVFEAALHARTI